MAYVDGIAVPLAAGYRAMKGKVEIGIRPEFVSLGSGSAGLPVTVRRIEDVGRTRIVRAEFLGREINAVLPEGTPVPTDANRLTFAPDKINVYAEDWRVAAGDRQ